MRKYRLTPIAFLALCALCTPELGFILHYRCIMDNEVSLKNGKMQSKCNAQPTPLQDSANNADNAADVNIINR